MEVSITWEEFLRQLAGPGVAVAVGLAASELARYVPQFNPLAPKWKRLVFLGLCLLVPLSASALGILTCEWSFSWSATLWPAIVSGVVAFGSGTLSHTRKLKDWRLTIMDLTAQVAAARAEVDVREERVGW